MNKRFFLALFVILQPFCAGRGLWMCMEDLMLISIVCRWMDKMNIWNQIEYDVFVQEFYHSRREENSAIVQCLDLY